MSVLDPWIHSPLVEGLAWALVHFLWQGVLIALLLAGGLALGRRASASWRYAAASAALLMMPAAFALTLAIVIPKEEAAAASWGVGAFRAQTGGTGAGWEIDWSAPLRLTDRTVWIVPVWMTCVLALCGRTLGAWLMVRRMRRTGVWSAPAVWQERIDGLAGRLRVSRPVRLLESCLAEAPVVIGYFRPVILVPASMLSGLPAAQLEAVLAHELAHIRRHDYLVNLLQSLVEALLFYHPATWWVSGQVRAERENCCDDVAVTLCGDAAGYAAALAALEEKRWLAAETALAATGGKLVHRIVRLLNRAEGGRPAAMPIAGAAILLVLAAWMAFAWHPQAEPATLNEALASPYEKWVKEDVVYLITLAEQKAYKSLTADDERAHFIQQFWERRDPTPGTVRNEFRDEHYRRIAYANERFAGTNMAGWRTDRGRTYIIFGPPDEIESHPAPSKDFPYEIWRYRYIDGIGSDLEAWFLDPQLTGDYRLVPAPRRY